VGSFHHLQQLCPLLYLCQLDQVELPFKHLTLTVSMCTIPDRPRVTIIGAGPVGLWTAVQIKQQDETIAVKIFEKHEEYQRVHGLRLNIQNLQSPHNGEHLVSWIQSLQNVSSDSKTIFVSTKELEDKLLEVATSLGVEIVYEAVNTTERLKELAETSNILVGADGSKSFVRETAFADSELKTKDFKFIIELKFQFQSEASNNNLMFDKVKELYPTEKLLNFLAEEQICEKINQGTNKRQSTLRFFVDEETYTNLGIVTFKNPKNLKNHWSELPKKLQDDILAWFAAKQMTKKLLDFKPEECAISKLTISAYRSPKVYQSENSMNYILVGDSAGGVPYFKALNIALKSSSTLANHVIKFLKDDKDSKDELVKYEEFYTKLIRKEITRAEWKTVALNQVDKFVKISSKVPWQVNKWGRSDQKRMKNIGLHIQEFILGKAINLDYNIKDCQCEHHQPVESFLARLRPD